MSVLIFCISSYVLLNEIIHGITYFSAPKAKAPSHVKGPQHGLTKKDLQHHVKRAHKLRDENTNDNDTLFWVAVVNILEERLHHMK